MPKGSISKDQLSQILLVYLGMAADIMELFEVFKEEQVNSEQLINVSANAITIEIEHSYTRLFLLSCNGYKMLLFL